MRRSRRGTVDVFELHADLCKTLSHPKRLMILALLGNGEMSVGEMASIIRVPLANVSQHLAVLKAQRVVLARKDGQTVHYRLADRRIIRACALTRAVLLDHMKANGVVARRLDSRYVITLPS